MKQYGLIGKTLGHSFSKKFFTEKFSQESIEAQYDLFELPEISHFPCLTQQHEFYGLNVTIPYKESVIQYLDELDKIAAEIGAVNTIKFIRKNGRTTLKGYNTDIIGFTNSITPYLKKEHKKALILGTGGASKAIAFALTKLGIEYTFVSRKKQDGILTYQELSEEIIHQNKLIINCTPIGTFPNCDIAPEIPYKQISSEHFLYDLIYNPAKTLFCQLGEENGAISLNGLEMLHGQAIASWTIWNQ
jgi:shikimate dehydrogenase